MREIAQKWHGQAALIKMRNRAYLHAGAHYLLNARRWRGNAQSSAAQSLGWRVVIDVEAWRGLAWRSSGEITRGGSILIKPWQKRLGQWRA